MAAFYALANTLAFHTTKGPLSVIVNPNISDACFDHWWSFFLFIQNYTHPENMVRKPTQVYFNLNCNLKLFSSVC